MTTSTPLACALCHRIIGAEQTHYVTSTEPPQVVCSTCRGGMVSSIGKHAVIFPDCADVWHDLWDHTMMAASRAGAYAVMESRSAAA